LVRRMGSTSRRDPKKSERERRAPLFRDEINKRKKKVHTHFVGQAPERSDCRFRVSEILKKKNVGENAGGVQVGEKELTVAKVARETDQFDEHNNQNAQWVDTKNAANDERREQRSTGGTGFLAFEGKQQNQTGVNKKDQDAEMADGHQIEVAAQGRSVLEVEQEVKKNNGENGAGSEEVQVCALRSGVPR
jgi:hypothetical protein